MVQSIKKHKASMAWIHRHINDPYVKQAQQQGFRARSAFKLIGLDEKYDFFRPDTVVVDLGCAPGGWCQVARQRFKAIGVSQDKIARQILGVDLLEMAPLPGVHFIQGDFREEAPLKEIEMWLAGRKVDLVLSDLSPNLSGVGIADTARMEHLLELCLEFAESHLSPTGTLVVKAFHGSGYSQMISRYKQVFHKVEAFKPKASRDESAETYVIARNKRAQSVVNSYIEK